VDNGFPHIQSMDRLDSAANLQFGRSIQSGYQHAMTKERPESQANYSIKSVETVFNNFPVPKPKTAKERKALVEKEKLEAEERERQNLIPKTVTNEKALEAALSWKNSVNVQKKNAVGTLASAKYDEKTSVFSKVHQPIEEQANLFPPNSYFGPKPDPEKAKRFDRRVVKDKHDSEVSSDEEDDFEDVACLKRQRRTILTQENLTKYLSHETLRLNLEHHYWLKNTYLAKMSKLAPNLTDLTLKRLNIDNDSFSELVKRLHHV